MQADSYPGYVITNDGISDLPFSTEIFMMKSPLDKTIEADGDKPMPFSNPSMADGDKYKEMSAESCADLSGIFPSTV